MNKHRKMLLKVLQGNADANIPFEGLCDLLKHLGFDERISGSHHVFRRAGVEDRINLQCDGDKAKVYQVRQVRAMISRNNLGSEL